MQDVLDNGVELDSSTIAHVWKWWFDPSKHEDTAGKVVASSNTSMPRPDICSLSKGCGMATAEDEIPGWFNELAAVTKKVIVWRHPLQQRLARLSVLECLNLTCSRALSHPVQLRFVHIERSTFGSSIEQRV